MTYNLTFLGTCAANFSKKLQNECRDCFDKDARRASCVLFNERFLIDCGPHALDSMRIAGVNPGQITDLFLTHLHDDHFNPDNVQTVASAAQRPLRVWVSADAKMPPLENVVIMPMEPRTTLTVNDELTVTGLAANHAPESYPQHLLFEREGKKFLYSCDGGWFLNPSFNYLRKSGLALWVVDATCGDYEGDFRMADHNSIPMIRLMLPSMRTIGAINDDTQVYLSHIAPSLHKSHDETVEIVKPSGLHVAYDGLVLSV
ncbi:MAG: MBL fold metallo-hydrolase [Clostridia bacterium]|nr:MBL fold metallo-hydrolase [Clostridia bacterium]